MASPRQAQRQDGAAAPRRPPGTRRKRAVITGGAGFIGTNLCAHLAARGEQVVIYDSLSRPGVEDNAAWLRERHGDRVAFEIADVRDFDTLRTAVGQAREVFHLAAQVAVTTSIECPVTDFEINARGTLNLLEALRGLAAPPLLVFTSTNKVYGGLDGLELERREHAWMPLASRTETHGISETQRLDFRSPYGCSKGTADQYVLDYARIFGLPATVFRMSCIYGPHQHGNEDQGWAAHFLRRALAGAPITIYGDGRQVRDLLYVDDLVDAFMRVREGIGRLQGHAFNIGGGPANAASLREVLRLIESLGGRPPEVTFAPWRPGDQRYYVSDIRRFRAMTGWAPAVDVESGLGRLWHWLQSRAPGLELRTTEEAAA